MKHSEFWNAVDAVWGSAYGRSLACDLVLPTFGVTAAAALDEGVDVRDVWMALCDEMTVAEEQRWTFRIDPRERRRTVPGA